MLHHIYPPWYCDVSEPNEHGAIDDIGMDANVMPVCKHYGNMRSNSTSLLSPHVVLLEDIQLILSLTAAPQIRPPVFNKILYLPS